MNEVLKCIETRRSIKGYTDKMPPREHIDLVIKAGLEGASGRNKQAPIIVAVTNKDIRDKMEATNGEMYGNPKAFYGAPALLVVLAKKEAHTYVYDGSITLANMMLAAHSLGLGACWIHRAKETFEMPEWKEWLKSIGIEDEVEGIGNLILGYPAVDYPAPKPRADGRVFRVE